MSRKLTFNVIHLLRGASRQQSLERLRREGHRNVSVLRSSDIEALLAAAVEETVSALGLELADETLAGLSEDARLRFVRLVKERDDLKATLDALRGQGDRLEFQQGSLRSELQRAESELSTERDAGPAVLDEELAALRERLRSELTALMTGRGADPSLTGEALALIEGAIEGYRVLVAARVRREQEARVTQLHRRIEKLRRKLEESEVLLARARAAGAEGLPLLTDIGPPLQPGDPGYAQKRELLQEIFNLNLELQRIIGAPADKGGADAASAAPAAAAPAGGTALPQT